MCKSLMQLLVKVQHNDGLQLAVLLLMYFLLIGIFKMLLEIIGFLGVIVFYGLHFTQVYRLQSVHLTGTKVI